MWRDKLKQYDENPIFLSLMETIQIRVMSLSVTGIEHRNIEPITKHLSHCKVNQCSWPNQIDRSERNTKLFKSCIKEFTGDSNNIHRYLIINPTIHRISKNTPQKKITSDRSPRTSRRTWYWESKREKKLASYLLWTRRSVINYSRFIGRAIGLM